MLDSHCDRCSKQLGHGDGVICNDCEYKLEQKIKKLKEQNWDMMFTNKMKDLKLTLKAVLEKYIGFEKVVRVSCKSGKITIETGE